MLAGIGRGAGENSSEKKGLLCIGSGSLGSSLLYFGDESIR